MGTISVEIFIARPPQQVFEYLRDYANEAKWQSDHVAQVIVEPPGPAKVGTRFHKVRRTAMGEQRFTEEVTEMDEASRRWTDVTMTGPFRGTTGAWQILVEEGGSRVRLIATMRAQGLWRLLLPMIDRSAAKDLHAEFMNLKTVLESTPQA